jgi:hypothetical protein
MAMEDHNLECPRCAAEFSMELTRCPRCGLNIYPEDEDENNAKLVSPSRLDENDGIGAAIGAVVLGWFLAGVIVFLVHLLVSGVTVGVGLKPGPMAVGWQMVLFLTGPVGAFAGAYAAGKVTRQERWPAVGIGAWVGFGSIAAVVLMETRWRLVTAQVLVEPCMLAGYILCISLGVAGSWLAGMSNVER